jgi:hypothetical protein
MSKDATVCECVSMRVVESDSCRWASSQVIVELWMAKLVESASLDLCEEE